MEKIFSLVLAGCLVFGVSAIAKAQPPEPLVQLPPKHFPRSPENTTQGFIRDSGNLGAYYSDYVEGYDPGNPALQEILQEINGIIKQDIGKFVLTAKDITIVPNPQNSDLATADFTLEFSDAVLGLRLAQKDSVQLKRHPIPNNEAGGKNEYWSILPGDPQNYFKSFETVEDKTGFTERLATLLAYPKQMLPKIHLQQSELQLKQLGLALMMFSQDYNNQLVFTPQDYMEKLTPYVKNKAVFTAPDENSREISYGVNPNIAGLKLTGSLDYGDIVAFYLGKDQKLDFRYDGLSPVCFLDGHVEAVTPEEAKNLQWKP